MSFNPQAPNRFVYPGNPNGYVAGNAAGALYTGSPADDCENSVTGAIWTCTTTGPASTAVWTAQGTVTSVATAGLATGGPIIGAGTVTVTPSTTAQAQAGTDTTTAMTPAATAAAIAAQTQAMQLVDNGLMRVAQRGTTFSGLNGGSGVYTSVYTLDRWAFVSSATSGNNTVSQQPDGPEGYEFSLRVQRTSGNTVTLSSNVMQEFPTLDVARYQGETVTVSFQARCGANYSGASSQVYLNVNTGTGTDEGVLSLINGTWTGLANVISTGPTLTTTWSPFSYTAVIGASVTEMAFRISVLWSGTAGANDWVEFTGVAITPVESATPNVFPDYSTDLYRCQTYAWVGQVYVPATTAQNLATLHMRATPSVSGGGSGFTSTGTSASHLIGCQTTGAVETLTLSADF